MWYLAGRHVLPLANSHVTFRYFRSVASMGLVLQRCTKHYSSDTRSFPPGLLLQMCTSIIPLDNRNVQNLIPCSHVISSDTEHVSLSSIGVLFFRKCQILLHYMCVCSMPHSTSDSYSIHTQQFI